MIADLSYYIEKLRTRFPFVGSRINFNNLNSNIYLKSDQKNISVDATSFIENLIEEKKCSKDDVIIYIGDSLTENGYEFYLNDLLKIIPFLVNEIPQHHYLIFKDLEKIIYISFENDVEFAEIFDNV